MSDEDTVFRFEIEVGKETDGRWLADVTNVPGAMAYADSAVSAALSAFVTAWWAMHPQGDAPMASVSVAEEGDASEEHF